jgi:hypothetical protein
MKMASFNIDLASFYIKKAQLYTKFATIVKLLPQKFGNKLGKHIALFFLRNMATVF